MLLQLLLLPAAWGAVLTVGGSGGDFTTIQDALDSAGSGDRIEVAPGTYPEAVDLRGLEVTLVSTGGPSVTTIDATGLGGFALTFETGESADTVVDGFTLVNRGGSGVLIIAAGPTLRDLVLAELGSGYDLGGAAYIEGGEPRFEGCVFRDNAAALGGHVYITGFASVTFEGCLFEGGRAEQRGGALDLGALSAAALTESSFQGNVSEGIGGAISAASGALIELNDVDLSENIAQGGGGAVALEAGAVLSALTGTWSDNSSAADGGAALLSEGSVMSLDTVLLSGNAASGSGGGAALVGGDNSLTLFSCSLYDNVAERGGGISAGSYDDVVIEFGELSDNQAIDSGGAVSLDSTEGDGTLELTSVRLARNLAGGAGGALALRDAARGVDASLLDCELTGNRGDGGGAVDAASFSDLLIEGGSFSSNVDTAGCGGGLRLIDADAELRQVTFTQNESAADGGGACVLGEGSLSAAAVDFEGNIARGDGGGLAFSATDLTLSAGSISGNQADGSGGGVALSGSAAARLDAVLVDENIAAGDGGGVYGNAVVYLEAGGLRLCGNQASDGGGLYLREPGSGSAVSNTVFQGNQAGRYGGGLALITGDGLALSNSTLVGNSAATSGAAVFANSAALSFVNNAVTDHSGSEALSGNSDTLARSGFSYSDWYDNSAGDLGGALVAVDLGADGHLAADPEYRSFIGGFCESDLRLEPESPLIDAGDPALLDPDGSRSDIGAYGGPGAAIEDADGDGWSSGQDCNDEDASIHPGAEEVWYDGVDQDCDGASDYDADGDGHDSELYKGDDCDDGNSEVYPGARDPDGDGVDADCDGWDGAPPPLGDTGDTAVPAAIEDDPPEPGSGKRCATTPAGAGLLLALAGLISAGSRRRRS